MKSFIYVEKIWKIKSVFQKVDHGADNIFCSLLLVTILCLNFLEVAPSLYDEVYACTVLNEENKRMLKSSSANYTFAVYFILETSF